MEDGVPRIPAEPYIRNSFHSIKRLPTLSGHFRFDSDASDKAGHADEFWAAALALHAASSSGPPAGTATGDPYRRDWQAGRSGLLSAVSEVGAARNSGMSPLRRERSRIWGDRN